MYLSSATAIGGAFIHNADPHDLKSEIEHYEDQRRFLCRLALDPSKTGNIGRAPEFQQGFLLPGLPPAGPVLPYR